MALASVMLIVTRIVRMVLTTCTVGQNHRVRLLLDPLLDDLPLLDISLLVLRPNLLKTFRRRPECGRRQIANGLGWPCSAECYGSRTRPREQSARPWVTVRDMADAYLMEKRDFGVYEAAYESTNMPYLSLIL